MGKLHLPSQSRPSKAVAFTPPTKSLNPFSFVQVCEPIVDDVDDDELLDENSEKLEDAVTSAGSLLLWRQCLRPPCDVVDADRERDDLRLKYGYNDEDDEDAYVATDPWQRRRRRGQCVTKTADENGEDAADDSDDNDDVDDLSTTVWPAAVLHCLPNGATEGDKSLPPPKQHGRGRRRPTNRVCGRLRVTLDPNRLRRGTRVSAVCHSLRRLLARAWIRDEDEGPAGTRATDDRWNRLYVMCETDRQTDRLDSDNRDAGRRSRRRRRVTVQVSIVSV